MDLISNQQINQFVQACHKVGEYNLLSCSSGNMSWRCGGQALVTGSGSWIKEMTQEQVTIADLGSGETLNHVKPSVEFRFHQGILNNRPDVDVVLHFQTPGATTLACQKNLEEINFFVIPEIMIYIKRIGIIPYKIPGSEELANAVVEVMKDHNLGIMKNHGMVIVGKTFKEVIQNAVFFELACQIILNAGDKLNPLSKPEIAKLEQIFKA